MDAVAYETPAKQTISIMADVVTVQYKFYNGILCYRHYNETKKEWIEPYWIPMT